MSNIKFVAIGAALVLVGLTHAEAAERASPARTHFIAANLARLAAQPFAPSKLNISQRDGALDTIAPSINLMRLPAQWDMMQARNQIPLRIWASDDMSGLLSVGAALEGPTGQLVWLDDVQLPAPPNWAGVLAWNPDRLVAPGAWKINYVRVSDANFNSKTYSGDELNSFRNTQTRISNQQYDAQAPQFISGQVTTPQLSLSRVIPGSNGHAQFVALRVRAQDVNPGGQASGLGAVSARLCVVGDRDCHYSMYVVGSGDGERTGAPMDMDVAAPLPWDLLPATYEIREVSLLDNAGNQTFLTSAAYGGNTDFTKLFPTTTVKIKP